MNIGAELQSLLSFQSLINLAILFVLELVLGIDNVIFISLVIARLPEGKRFSARVAGLSLALLMRLIMLFVLVWLSKIATVLFSISGFNITIRDMLFFIGGVYLIWSTMKELKEHLNKKGKNRQSDISNSLTVKKAIVQIVMVDVLFSFDSIFTAIGLLQSFFIMALAIILAMFFMLYLSGKISALINKYSIVKTLALVFIIAVGIMLLANAFHFELTHEAFNVT